MSTTLAVTVISAVLVALSLGIHYYVLRAAARFVLLRDIYVGRPILFVFAGIFVAHLIEVMLFAIAYYVMHWSVTLGGLAGAGDVGTVTFTTYFYFSLSAYTTLGIGDIIPTGDVRLLVGIEALVGLVLIAWSASFSYLMMERVWRDPKHD